MEDCVPKCEGCAETLMKIENNFKYERKKHTLKIHVGTKHTSRDYNYNNYFYIKGSKLLIQSMSKKRYLEHTLTGDKLS